MECQHCTLVWIFYLICLVPSGSLLPHTFQDPGSYFRAGTVPIWPWHTHRWHREDLEVQFFNSPVHLWYVDWWEFPHRGLELLDAKSLAPSDIVFPLPHSFISDCLALSSWGGGWEPTLPFCYIFHLNWHLIFNFDKFVQSKNENLWMNHEIFTPIFFKSLNVILKGFW